MFPDIYSRVVIPWTLIILSKGPQFGAVATHFVSILVQPFK